MFVPPRFKKSVETTKTTRFCSIFIFLMTTLKI